MNNLTSRRLALVPITELHYPQLIEWRNTEDYIFLIGGRRHPVPPGDFAAEMKKEFIATRHAQYMVQQRKDGVFIGTIHSSAMNREDGHCFIGAFIDEKYRRRGYGPETMLLYVRYLFAMYALRKIYVEIFDYNALSLGSLLSTGLPEGCITKEGCFKGHRYFNGAYHDVHRFAIYPEAVRHFSWLDNKESRHNSS